VIHIIFPYIQCSLKTYPRFRHHCTATGLVVLVPKCRTLLLCTLFITCNSTTCSVCSCSFACYCKFAVTIPFQTFCCICGSSFPTSQTFLLVLSPVFTIPAFIEVCDPPCPLSLYSSLCCILIPLILSQSLQSSATCAGCSASLALGEHRTSAPPTLPVARQQPDDGTSSYSFIYTVSCAARAEADSSAAESEAGRNGDTPAWQQGRGERVGRGGGGRGG
jgi:hypothetical protein